MSHGSAHVLALSILVLAAGVPASVADPAKPALPGGTPYASSKSCAVCHDVMYKAWSDSAHARAATSPAYLEAIRRTVERADDKKAAREACIWCHAPTTILTGDVELKEPISREGITCDFCHTVAGVDLGRVPPFESKPGAVKRGPFEYAHVQGHEAAYSSLHRSSPLLCASCHEFNNANGVAVLSNYSEWKEGPYPARGVGCQDCHMALVPGTVASVAGPRGSQRVVNLHRLVGGSATSQLARGLELSIESVSASSGSAEVAVAVTNDAAGHSVPGGLATKSLVLAVGVEAADGTLAHRQERVYRRELKDDKGVVLQNVADMFLRAASVGTDSRIKPRESRRERFAVPLPSWARAIVVRLEYRDASDPRGGPITSLITEVKHPLGVH
jgi:hypothetical protein